MTTDSNPAEPGRPSRSLTFFEGYEVFPGLLDHPPRILDTAQVMDELKSYVYPRMSFGGVIASTNTRRARLLASRHVFDEMYQDDGHGHTDKFEKLSEQSRHEGWPTESAVFQRAFESQYLHLINFVETSDLFSDDPAVLSVGNAKDVPTARLAVLLALDSPIVFSRDTHLHRPGLATKNPEVVLHAAATMEAVEFSIYASGYLSVTAAQRLNRNVKQVSEALDISPAWTWGALLLVGSIILVYALQTPERRATVTKALEPIAGVYVGIVREGRNAQISLAALAVPMPEGPTLAQRIAHALVNAPYPQTVASILGSLSIDSTRHALSEEEVLNSLDSLPCFVRDANGRWELGQTLRPPNSRSHFEP